LIKFKDIIFFDLDGTLLNVKYKYYNLYRDILLKENNEYLNIEQFWELKRSKKTSNQILSETNCKIAPKEFDDAWINGIESPKYLSFDSLDDEVGEVLSYLQYRKTMVILTMRRRKDLAIRQVKELKIYEYFSDFLTSPRDQKPNWKVKYEMLKRYIGKSDRKHVMVGDSEADIISGNKLNFMTVAISNGIRNEKCLISAKPDHIISSLNSKAISIFEDESR
jgi:phosphoglycolate phosphatase